MLPNWSNDSVVCCTTLEDEYIVSRNSAGLHSRLFEPGPYHPEFEHTLQQFVAWYLATLSASLETD